MSDCTPITECLACGSSQLIPTLDLGNQPLANNFKSDPAQPEPSYPLAINRCGACNHLQLTHAVDPALIYTHYLYVSGTSNTYVEYMDWYARFVREQLDHWPTTVLDIGCNDGSQLTAFKRIGFKTYGVDPAENLYPTSSAEHNVVLGFWNTDTATWLDTEFDVITTQNAFAHIPNPIEYLTLAGQYLKHDGKIFISTSQADMVINGEFDTIYHEHISFFNSQSMKKLCERAGLYLVDVNFMPIHGTSYIFTVSKKERKGNIDLVIDLEREDGLYNPETYVKYAARCDSIVDALITSVSQYTRNEVGWLAVGYGAPAKGMTLLNYSGLKLDFIIDDNELKQGRFTPGSSIPIYSADVLDDHPDALLFVPLAWNFFDEIVEKIKARRNNKYDRFCTYFPSVRVRS